MLPHALLKPSCFELALAALCELGTFMLPHLLKKGGGPGYLRVGPWDLRVGPWYLRVEPWYLRAAAAGVIWLLASPAAEPVPTSREVQLLCGVCKVHCPGT